MANVDLNLSWNQDLDHKTKVWSAQMCADFQAKATRTDQVTH